MGIWTLLQEQPLPGLRTGVCAMVAAFFFAGAAPARQAAPEPAAKPAVAPAAATPAPAVAADQPASATAAVIAPPAKVLPPIPAGLGRVAGRVTVAGLAPKLAPVPVGKDMKACGTSKVDEALEVGTGGSVKNALLWVPDGPAPAKHAKPKAKVSLSGCQFVPHVSATAVPGELVLTNEDAIFHNATATGLLPFNYAMPIKGHTIPTKLKKEGVLKLESKSHQWMKGWVHALGTTSFMVTDADGTFYLDLPPGPHTLKLWHERLGEREDKVEVVAGETTVRDLAMAPR